MTLRLRLKEPDLKCVSWMHSLGHAHDAGGFPCICQAPDYEYLDYLVDHLSKRDPESQSQGWNPAIGRRWERRVFEAAAQQRFRAHRGIEFFVVDNPAVRGAANTWGLSVETRPAERIDMSKGAATKDSKQSEVSW